MEKIKTTKVDFWNLLQEHLAPHGYKFGTMKWAHFEKANGKRVYKIDWHVDRLDYSAMLYFHMIGQPVITVSKTSIDTNRTEKKTFPLSWEELRDRGMTEGGPNDWAY